MCALILDPLYLLNTVQHFTRMLLRRLGTVVPCEENVFFQKKCIKISHFYKEDVKIYLIENYHSLTQTETK